MPLAELKEFADVANQMVLDQDRKTLAAMTFKNEQFYRGLTDEFIHPFQGEKSEDFRMRLKPSANVTKRVVNAFLAAMYGLEIKRDFNSSKNQTILKTVLDQNGQMIQDAMRWHKRSELSGTSYVIPRWDFEKLRFFQTTYSAESIFPISEPDDPFKLRALVINFNLEDDLEGPNRKMHVRREVWTPDEFLVMHDDDVAKNSDGEDLHNGHDFKAIPGAFFKPEDDHEAFLPVPPATDVRKMHEQLLEMLSTTAEVFRYQAFNVLFYKNPGTDEVVVGPRKFVSTNNKDAELSSVQFQAEIEKLFASITTWMEMIADLGEVPSMAVTNKATAESGLALSIKFMPHLQAVNRRRLQFKQAEQKLWADYIRLSTMVGAGAGDLGDEALVSTIDFPDVPMPQSLDDAILQSQFDLNNGLTSPTQIMRERNPEMSEDQARKEIEENLAETMTLRRSRLLVPGENAQAAAASALNANREANKEKPPASGVEA